MQVLAKIEEVDGSGSGLDADLLDGIDSTGYWKLGGNSGTTSSDFLGTTDNQPLSFRVNNAPALRIEPDPTGPNLIGGHSANSVTAGVHTATISGGGQSSSPNLVTNEGGTIGGGLGNRTGSGTGASDDNRYSTVAGGWINIASGDVSTVGGGVSNESSGVQSTVGGGGGNTASGNSATVAGGFENSASGDTSTVAGGFDSAAGGDYSTVPGGYINAANGDYSAVAGGFQNSASGDFSTVVGGMNNAAGGLYGLAAGQRAKANHDGTFVWGDSQGADIASTGPNQFIARANGGFWLGTTSAPSFPANVFLNTSTGAHLTDGGTWTNNSDRESKQGFEEVDGEAVLARLAGLPITTWSYKADADGIRHMGPMAQDFHAAFGLGSDEKSISTVDADGIALAAIKAENRQREAENRELRATVAELSERVEALERRREAG